jgi:mono/diheme cytochrome c family protein
MNSQLREKSDPHELDNPVPYSVSAVILGLAIWSVSYIFWTSHVVEESIQAEKVAAAANAAPASAPSTTEAPLVASKKTKSVKSVDGKAIYSAKCSSCHQATGKGLAGVFPPLDASSWVTSAKHDLPVQIIAKGLTGKIKVAGTDYNGIMPAFGESLSTAEMAAVVTYIRGAWSNKAGKVTTTVVEESLAAYQSQSGSWNGEAQLTKDIGAPK